MLSDKTRQFLVVFSVVMLIVMNYLSNARVFGGVTNGDISAKYETLITPAGWAFSIWGVIFLGLLAFAIYQVLPAQRTNPRFRAAGPWVIANGLLNAIWSPIFNQEQIGLALLVIVLMLLTLRKVVDALQVGQESVSATETWLVRVPFLIYFGWLTVATIVNVAVWLVANEFALSGLAEPEWAVAVLVTGLIIGTYLAGRYRSAVYILVFTWAYAAIAAKHPDIRLVRAAGIAGALSTLVVAVRMWLRSRGTSL